MKSKEERLSVWANKKNFNRERERIKIRKKNRTYLKNADSVYKNECKKSSLNYKDKNRYTCENAKNFLLTFAWRKLRVDIIEEQGGKCQMCGRSYASHGVSIHVDHIIPLSIDWSKRLDRNNLQLLCEDCNLGKSNRYNTNWKNRDNVSILFGI